MFVHNKVYIKKRAVVTICDSLVTLSVLVHFSHKKDLVGYLK